VLAEALQAAFKAKRATEEAGYRAMVDEIAAMTPETQKAVRFALIWCLCLFLISILFVLSCAA
jgi:hypothetical protein